MREKGPAQSRLPPRPDIVKRVNLRSLLIPAILLAAASSLGPQARAAEKASSTHPLELSVSVPRHARAGLEVQISIRYRNIDGGATIHATLSPPLAVEQVIPDAKVRFGGELVWRDLRPPSGSVKIKARIRSDARPGSELIVGAFLIDRAGNTATDEGIITIR